MGYNTEFSGNLFIKPDLLNEKLTNFLLRLSETRRMKRKVSFDYGIEGEFYVEGGGDFGQNKEENIIDYNEPPSTQPGLWCDWRPFIVSETGNKAEVIGWNGNEKTYDSIEWIKYIVENFLLPFGYWLEGEVLWQGEDIHDRGTFKVDKDFIYVKAEEDATPLKIAFKPRMFFRENCFESLDL